MLTTPRQNRLLAALSDVDQRAFADHLEAVPLSVGQVLERPGTPCTHAYFIDSGIVSVVAMGAQRRAEVAVVGNEGATGLAGVLPGARSGDELTIQVAGTAQRIATHDLTSVAAARPALRTLLLLYVHTTTIQASHTCLAYASGSILERLARWLLMAHDRVLGDVLCSRCAGPG
jgi:CRP-like cAMP-binding protein